MTHNQPKKGQSSFRDRVYAVVAQIPSGRVLTYGEVARRVGRPGAARAVGTAMKKNPDHKRIPCHRVVRSDGLVGDYAFGGPETKRSRLRKEGIRFTAHGTIDRIKRGSR